MVIIPKSYSDDIRLCVDMRAPNEAIQRERHTSPTLDDLKADLNGSKYFSKLDLTQGYHQIELDPASRNITTFSTHLGLRRYKRLNFGVTSAAEIFQNIISGVIANIPRTINMSDDILIYGRTLEEHNHSLRRVLEALKNAGLTLNEKKCEFAVE